MSRDFHKNNISIVNFKSMPFELNVETRSFFIGSCFSSNLYSRFQELYLNSNISPFGNIYNPISLCNALDRVISNKSITEEECFINDGLYQHFDFYTKLGKPDSGLYVEYINNSISNAHKELLSADLLIITLGTSWVYEINGKVVNNCHRLPKETFKRRLLTIDEITSKLISVLKKLQKKNNKVNIVLTLSPVRHLRDSFEENSLSKAILRVAISNVLKSIKGIYFPSYEIVMDELRDYRWFNDDLAHPTAKAVDYITGRFIESSASDEFISYLKRVEKVNSLINHKINNPYSDSSKNFIIKREKVVKQFIKDFPGLDTINISKMFQDHLQKNLGS